ncbi:MAG: DUF3168 domain-containing protein [Cohnella sp.]|nr:DUF3168 domain-containing protein [Cohnella sp.]
MIFEEALVMELKSITALNDHVYPLNAPEKVRKTGAPYLIYISSQGVRTKTLGGYRGGKRVSVELNVVASTYESMKEITASVIKLIEGMEQRTIGEDGPYLQEVTYEEPVELYESAPALFRCLIDFTTFFEEVD